MGTWAHGSIGMRHGRGRGFTLVEVILTILVVGVGFVASVRALPVLLQISEASQRSLVAQRLATDLMSEIAMLPFEEPDTEAKFGPEPGEATDTRVDFDDIDDYDGWKTSPPQKKDGRVEPDCSGYTQAVVVQSVDVDDFDHVRADGSTDATRVTITITHEKMPPVTVTLVRLRGANREDLE